MHGRWGWCLGFLLLACGGNTGGNQTPPFVPGDAGQPLPDAAAGPGLDAAVTERDAASPSQDAAMGHATDAGPGLLDAGAQHTDAGPQANDAAVVDAAVEDAAPAATCGDAILNGGETGVDCGGPCPLRCGLELGCTTDADCASSLCRASRCIPSTHFSGRVFARPLYLPIAAATVAADTGEEGLTEASGNISLVFAASATALHVTAPGHVEQWVMLRGASSNLAEDISMAPVGFVDSVPASTGGTVAAPGGITLEIPPQSWVDGSGAPYLGDVTMDLTSVDLSSVEERGTVPLDFPVSGAMGPEVLNRPVWAVDLTASTGNQRLQVAPGQTLSLTVEVPLEDPVAQLWVYSFDPATRTWRPEGVASRVPGDSRGQSYSVTLHHLSWYLFALELAWNGASASDYGCLSGTVMTSAGQPADATVSVFCYGGPNVNVVTVASTGTFEVFNRSGLSCSLLARLRQDTAQTAFRAVTFPAGSCLPLGVLQLSAPAPVNPCPGVLQQCAGTCVDASLSVLNCGSCGHACSQGQACVAGTCVCPEGKTLCGSGASAVCVDLRSSRTSCGTCGHACASKDFCAGGMCHLVPQCGDALVETGDTVTEVCDDGVNNGSYGGCMPGCGQRSARCGDGVVQSVHGETCEAASSAPCLPTCDDGDGCTVDSQAGSPAACTMACSHVTITAFVDADSCCPVGATKLTDSDCTAVCGNSVVEPPEACDDGMNNNSYGGCAPGCGMPAPYCGDGIVSPAYGESCEPGVVPCETSCSDGNFCTQDALTGRAEDCTAVCRFILITQFVDGDQCCPATADATVDNDCTATCGNNATELGEMCDDGNRLGADGCSADCQSDETCGNGFLDAWEACDDGGRVAGDGCSVDCLSNERCGNGVRDTMEACDDGNVLGGDGCSANCQSNEACGNGIRDAWEVCDDGNILGGDGCNATCRATQEVTTVSAGLNSTCAVTRSGALFCWGNNLLGKLATTAMQDNVQFPSRVGTALDWVLVAVGNDHRCAKKQDGSLHCWGYNDGGQVGNGTLSTVVSTPTAVAGAWGEFDAGYASSCALTAPGGVLHAWGTNAGGATPVTGGAGVVPYSRLSSRFSTAHIRPDGTAWSSSGPRGAPVQAGTATDWLSVSAYGPRCGLRQGGSAWCWGTNTYGQLGNGGTTTTTIPQEVAPGTTWLNVSAGNEHVCGVKTDHTLWCWGRNVSARLGIGSADANPHSAPIQVGVDADWASVSPADTNTCAVKVDGTLWCWGANTYFQLGLGLSSAARLTPQWVSLENPI